MAGVKVTDADQRRAKEFYSPVLSTDIPLFRLLAQHFAEVRADGFAAGVAAERAAFAPPPSDEERADGWHIGTAWLESVCEAMHTPDGERCSWEQIECVLLRAAAIRAGEVRG